MSFKLKITKRFEKELKRLTKKYPSIKTELIELLTSLQVNPVQGVAIGSGFYKIRLSIASKGKGKRGGARVITYVVILDEVVYLIALYDKSEKENFNEKELQEFLTQL